MYWELVFFKEYKIIPPFTIPHRKVTIKKLRSMFIIDCTCCTAYPTTMTLLPLDQNEDKRWLLYYPTPKIVLFIMMRRGNGE